MRAEVTGRGQRPARCAMCAEPMVGRRVRSCRACLRGELRALHAPGAPAERADERVYFLRTACRTFLKVGVTTDVNRRAQELRMGCPLRLVLMGHLGGGRRAEQRAHAALAAVRLHGEWFRSSSEVEALVEAWLAAGAVP